MLLTMQYKKHKKGWGEKGSPEGQSCLLALWCRVIIIKVKTTPLSLNAPHCRWKAYLGTSVIASQWHWNSCNLNLFSPSLHDLAQHPSLGCPGSLLAWPRHVQAWRSYSGSVKRSCLLGALRLAVLGLHGKVWGRDPALEQGKSLRSSALEVEGVAETTVWPQSNHNPHFPSSCAAVERR